MNWDHDDFRQSLTDFSLEGVVMAKQHDRLRRLKIRSPHQSLLNGNNSVLVRPAAHTVTCSICAIYNSRSKPYLSYSCGAYGTSHNCRGLLVMRGGRWQLSLCIPSAAPHRPSLEMSVGQFGSNVFGSPFLRRTMSDMWVRCG